MPSVNKLKTIQIVMTTTISLGIFVVIHAAFAEDTTSFAKIDVVYHPSTNTLDVTGIVYKTFSQNYALTIFDPHGRLIVVSQLQLSQNDTFSQSIVPSSTLWSESGNYTVKMASGPQVLVDKSFYFSGMSCCVQNSHGVQAGLFKTTNVIDSPLKQFKSGIAANNVKCGQSLELVIKAKDSSPACVKLDSAYTLIKRGWATSESAYPESDAQFALKTNSTIIPGHLPRSSGLMIPYQQTSRTITYTGFDGVYNMTLMFRGTLQDYVLKHGANGTMTFEIETKASKLPGQIYQMQLPKSLNLTNYAIFYHEITSIEDLSKYPGVTISSDYGFRTCFTRPNDGGTCQSGSFEGKNPIEAYVVDHPGVNVLFEPPSEVLQLGANTTSQVVTMRMSVDSDALQGTYLVVIPNLGEFLLTVGSQPYHE